LTPGATSVEAEVRTEFARQVQTLVRKGYPALAGLDERAFRGELALLEERALGVDGPIPFAIVVPGVLASRAVPLLDLNGTQGFTTMEPDDLARFVPIDGVELPASRAYLVTDVDAGRATRNVKPDAALETIVHEGRSPLTLGEGIAVVTHFPDLLRTQTCFSLLGSRCGDRRVTAIWLSAGPPRLGWCWAGNPHTWLGSASCAGRVAAAPPAD